MKTTYLAFVSCTVMMASCISKVPYGDEGQQCFENGTCLEGLVCGTDNVCVNAAALSGDGGQETEDGGQRSEDGGPATGDGSVAPDTGFDAGYDGGPEDLSGSSDAASDTSYPSDASDTGADTSADTGPDDAGVPDVGHDTGFDVGLDAGTPDAGADAGTADTGITISCGPSPTGKGGDMCDVPAGAFQMGCNSAVDTECQSTENPYHSVNVPVFKMDNYEVTASEYKACVTASGCTAAGTGSGCNYDVAGKESHPINCVDWNQAKAYCGWAGKKLPTEAEWEKAARGTDGRKYPWGNTGLDCDHAVHSVSPCSNPGTAAVGSKPLGVSPYGAEDMIGNVWEWVEDDWHGSYTGAPADGSAWVDAPRGTSRVMRGGSWNNLSTVNLRASVRYDVTPTGGFNNIGFRCARDGS